MSIIYIYIYNFCRKYKIFVIWKKPSRFIYSLDETRIMHIAKEFQSKPKFYGQKIWERKRLRNEKKKKKCWAGGILICFWGGLHVGVCKGVEKSLQPIGAEKPHRTCGRLLEPRPTNGGRWSLQCQCGDAIGN